MNLFSSPCELYFHHFLWENVYIPRNILYLRIEFSKLVTNINIYIWLEFSKFVTNININFNLIYFHVYAQVATFNIKNTHIRFD